MGVWEDEKVSKERVRGEIKRIMRHCKREKKKQDWKPRF